LLFVISALAAAVLKIWCLLLYNTLCNYPSIVKEANLGGEIGVIGCRIVSGMEMQRHISHKELFVIMCRGVTDHGSFTVVYICKNSFWRKMKC
jgi:hypothetical protein